MLKSQLLQEWQDQGIIKDENVLKAFSQVRREDFVPKEYRQQAYEDSPLPLGHGATISQPTTVMLMLQALEVKQGYTILEIGSGSGYNAALLSNLVGSKGKVVTIEYVKELSKLAEKNLSNFKNVKVVYADGKYGFKQQYQYHRIIITAACQDFPKDLLNQLRINGIILAPIGPFHNQEVIKAVKTKTELTRESIGSFVFVPLK
ncbi:MAG TPA: protein-L-isoaspartate(D-aspartate) O-methyltransferase [Candidatus Nanoarchaeia archaeon]|nr:protein-L-isoaspartate(D-aspartate) O-methyltransferase [Candidatus Nanoarchaeia archaeon]